MKYCPTCRSSSPDTHPMIMANINGKYQIMFCSDPFHDRDKAE